MSIIVRRMRKADSAKWASMRVKLWNDLSIDDHLGDIDRMLKDKKSSGYIALLDGHQPAGFAEIGIRDYANGSTARPVPFLEGIWVDPRYRRRGVGRALIEQVTTDLVAKGFQELCSDAEIRNRRSHQAHESWGFDETERVVYFRKKLS